MTKHTRIERVSENYRFVPQSFILACIIIFFTGIVHAADSLPSWNNTKPKQAIIEFVEKVTKEGPVLMRLPEINGSMRI